MDPVEVLRRFNRTYTRRIGALEESFLGTGRPLAVSRLLHEVGSHPGGGVAVASVRTRLDLDDGYLARMLRRLEGEGLVASYPDPADGRRRLVTLTEAGEQAYDDLEHRSVARAEQILDPLTGRQRERLADALATADLLVRAATVELREVDPTAPAAQQALGRYVAELAERFEGGFAAGPAHPADAGARFLLATSDGDPVAYGGIRALDPTTVEVKRMWVDASWRGAGLGARVLRELEALALTTGHTRVVLDTNSTLVEAVALYERAGYRRTERYNDNPHAEAFFEKHLG